MQITSLDQFFSYRLRIKERTRRLFDYIPEEEIEWSCGPGRFTIGDLIRHIAAIERYLFAEVSIGGTSRYKGCGKELAHGLDATKIYYDKMDEQSMQVYSSLENSDLMKSRLSPSGMEIRLWKWLRASLEHEIHHRGQLYVYLSMLNIKLPPLFGLTSEQLIVQA